MDAASAPVISGTTVTNNQINGVAIDDGIISVNTSWNSPGIVYDVTSGVNVAAGTTLSIGAGQVVKFKTGGELDVHGTLQALGTSANPVVFTSLKDDTAGGDTNADGNASAPSPGDWYAVYLDNGSTGNVLDHVEVRYAGSDPFVPDSDVVVDHAGATITNSILSDCQLGGLRVQASNPTVTNVTFQDNFGPAISMDDASSPVLNGLTFTNNPTNGVSIDNGTITANTTWNNPSVAYFINGSVTVDTGVTLTIGAGQVVKFKTGYNDLEVKGTLLAAGTASQPITFTSIRDDSAIGDTNNDGSNTSPAAGDWLAILLDNGSTGNFLDHVAVRYAGSDGFVAGGAIYANNAGLTLNNSTISNSAVGGIELAASSPTLTGDTFLNNNGLAIQLDDAVSNPTLSGASASGNTVNGISVRGGTLSGNTTWVAQSLPYSLSGNVTIPQGITLTIAAGAVLLGGSTGDFNGAGTIVNAGAFVMAASAANGSMNVTPQLIDTGTLDIRQEALNLNGGLIVNGSGVVTGNASAELNILGSLSGSTTNADQFAPVDVNFNGGGTAAAPRPSRP